MGSSRSLSVVVALSALACTSGVSAQGGTPATSAAPPMIATLNAVDSRIYGSIRVESGEKPNELRAKISVRGSTADQQLPWEIRAGTCGEKGQQLGPQAAFRTISIRSDGTGDVTAILPITLVADQRYSVNVLASRTNRGRVVACGVLTPA